MGEERRMEKEWEILTVRVRKEERKGESRGALKERMRGSIKKREKGRLGKEKKNTHCASEEIKMR